MTFIIDDNVFPCPKCKESKNITKWIPDYGNVCDDCYNEYHSEQGFNLKKGYYWFKIKGVNAYRQL